MFRHPVEMAMPLILTGVGRLLGFYVTTFIYAKLTHVILDIVYRES